jgi:type VI secretion system protein ImpM
VPEDPIAAVACGFFGKIPGRGDFVRAGLPRGFVAAWDEWLSAVLPASRAALGEPAWLAAWMEAPVWRFALPAGACGPEAALGLWMPSVDRAGRHFPLTIAATFAAAGPDEAWLDLAEDAGRTALESDIGPDELLGLLPPAAASRPAPDAAVWWTEGSPRVTAGRRMAAGLPDGRDFALMLDSSGADHAALS